VIDRNHPAVEAAAREIYVHDAPGNDPQAWPPAPPALADDYRGAARDVLVAALPHLANPVDARPWEPLSGGRVYVGDEVRRDYLGTTTTAVVGRVDDEGDPWTDEGRVIGILDEGTWYVRRTVQDLPTNPGAVIVPADGHEYIEATMRGETVRAREATRSGAGGWYAAWRSGEQTSGLASSREITPGTWKVDDR